MDNNQNANDQNAGAAGAGSSSVPDSGAGNATPGQTSGDPAGQGGTPPDPRDEKIASLIADNKALNQVVVDARRANRQGNAGGGANGDQGNPFDSEAGRYGVALKLATANLRDGLEERVSLYPELTPEEVQRIRLNPWAFAKMDSFMSGDWESALDEVEMAMLARAEQIAEEAKSKNTQEGTPANVNNNPTPEPGGSEGAVPGSEEDNDPWTMPLAKLEKIAAKEKAKLSTA